MGRDIYGSKRNYFMRCKFYKVDDDNNDFTELTYDKKPDGLFYAKKVNALTSQDGTLANVFMFDANTTTIKTQDYVKKLEVHDVVVFDDGTKWRVDNIQRSDIDKEEEFSKRGREITYIQLRK